ncbi:MAG: hypothetical protein JF570_07930, partial [Caulobacter sp.]|nr:hypothetical protein [Caulobacter sp.]
PLTANGKLDRRALPEPGGEAYVRGAYEAPEGEAETVLAGLWAELLGVERVGRRDSFFELGGHSLLAVRLLERLRRLGLGTGIRALFEHPRLSEFAATLGRSREVAVPANRIEPGSREITPSMVPLAELSQAEIDRVVSTVPGGVGNVQDLYGLSPLQDGILFHHLLAEQGDPYLLWSQMAFAERGQLNRYLSAVQRVVDRHDILRTAFVWEGLSSPVQVVWRHAPLIVTEVELDPADGRGPEQLRRRYDPRHHRIDLTRAPLLRFVMAQDPETGRWLVQMLQHHLIGDHSTLDILEEEIQAILGGREGELLPAQPFRNVVAQARLGIPAEEHERYFREQLGDIEEPVLPFGLSEVRGDGAGIVEARRRLPAALNDRLREQARRLGVSLASLCHVAWGQVVARTSGRETAVFGTVLFGRMQAGEGADRAMGLFINTLPLRLDLDGTGVAAGVRGAHLRLAELLQHEHASLALAQRCSGVAAGAPLFSSLLNYRHQETGASALPGVEWLGGEERTNYPFDLSVEDYGDALGLTAQVSESVSAERVVGLMQRALESLAEALEHAPETPLRSLEVLPAAERALLLETWNATQKAYPSERCIHGLFEEQVGRTPDAVAVEQGEVRLSYGELNARANRLAHRLIASGVCPDAPGRCGAAAGAGGRHGAGGAGRGAVGSRGDRAGRCAGDPAGDGPGGSGADVAAPGLCDLHLRLHRHAEGGAERAPGAGEPPGLDAGSLWPRCGRRGAAEDAVQLRCVGVGVLLDVAAGGPAGAGGPRGPQGPCRHGGDDPAAWRDDAALRAVDAGELPGGGRGGRVHLAAAGGVQRRGPAGAERAQAAASAAASRAAQPIRPDRGGDRRDGLELSGGV